MQSHPTPLEPLSEDTLGLAPVPASIVCGTDFSDASAQAVEVAAEFARRVNEPLVLVHAVRDETQKNLPGEVRESLAIYARAQYHEERERLRALHVDLVEAFHVGAPAAELLGEASAHHASLLVLAGGKKRRLSRWVHGSVTDRVAEAGAAPTLVVRDAAPLLRWIRGGRRLRVFVGADLSGPSDAALRWINWLRQMGPCDVVVAYFEPCLVSYPTVDLYPSLLTDDLILETTRKQERCFRKRVRSLLGRSNVRVRFEAGWGHSDAHLIQLATEERADLIVIGTHARRGWHRFGHHSVSRGVLHYAPLNVVCVPGPV